MKRSFAFPFFLVLLLGCLTLFFTGCPGEEEPPNIGGDLKVISGVMVGAGEIKYYSLSTGQEVTGDAINSNAWDIAFSRTRLVLTNSGATATLLTSGGQGGVWFTEHFSLEGVTQDDAVKGDPLLDPYTTDQARYVAGMGAPAETRLNVMSYVGYDNEAEADGLSSETALSGYSYNKKEYYASASMGAYNSTDRVYIIKHGDGTHYSKIQIAYEYFAAAASPTGAAVDAFVVSYQNF
jgi:hypothetical protein